MRHVCERCGAAQSPDAAASALCSTCGSPTRRELRCFWCSRWSPAGAHCRDCGAELVPDSLYGAARMLKRAGSDMFAVPRLLRELDPGRVEVFATQYAQQRAVVARQADQLAFVERFLVTRGLAAALEAELVESLPWDPSTLDAQRPPELGARDDDATLRLVSEQATLPRVRQLALVARLWRGDFSLVRELVTLVRSADTAVSDEAALAVSWWRTRLATGFVPGDEVVRALSRSRSPLHAAVRLAACEEPHDAALVRAALASGDDDLAFSAALVAGDRERLQHAAADADAQRALAATLALVELGELAAARELLGRAAPDAQRAVARAVAKLERPAPSLQDVLLELMERCEDDDTRTWCGLVLAREVPAGLAPRVAELSRGQVHVLQALLGEASGLTPPELAEVGRVMVERGWFRLQQYGMWEAIRRGAFPLDFVPRMYPLASSAVRRELGGFAEQQLAASQSQELYDFLVRAALGPNDPEVRGGLAMLVMRVRGRHAQSAATPFVLEPQAMVRVFGAVRPVVEALVALLRDERALRAVGCFDYLAELFAGATPEGAAALASCGEASRALAAALDAALGLGLWPQLQSSMVQLLAQLGRHEELRTSALATLRRLAGREGDLDYYVQRGLSELAVPEPTL